MRYGRTKPCAASLLLAAATLVSACDPEEQPSDKTSGGVILRDVRIPRHLTAEARQGLKIYRKWCSVCHGKATGGTEKGPPLVEYDRSHHSDDTFYKAVATGVKQHHWAYGDMPPLPSVSRSDVTKIIAFVRQVQRADAVDSAGHDALPP